MTSFTSRAAEKLRAQQGEAAAIMVEIRSRAFRRDAAAYAASRWYRWPPRRRTRARWSPPPALGSTAFTSRDRLTSRPG
ncbi:hypothetical protein [Lamprobacter modestohalophilus]|uniref:hypothetical protein n=1 Tax=Lamprobacter modestohalophilus TaxID=1064514 RepID=UPI00308412F5